MLSELSRGCRRLALVGLAKNTGKTEALSALLREHAAAGTLVGVTSVGRDGEEHDVIDFRIEKPRVHLQAHSLLATTDSLLSASGIPFELIRDTGIGTPLGRVLVARLKGAGDVEVAGPSAAEQIRAVSDVMLDSGAKQVLIDGAIDRRAASSPDVSDGLIMSTGAVLADDIDEVVEITRRAVELVRLPLLEEHSPLRSWLGERPSAADPASAALIDESLESVELPPRFVLTADASSVKEWLGRLPSARWLSVPGALPAGFLDALLLGARRGRRRITVVARDPTKVFLSGHEPSWYGLQGVEIRTLAAIELIAMTVNPLAPPSRRLDSAQLRRRLQAAIADVPIVDVLHPEYTGRSTPAAQAAAPAPPSLK